MPAVVGINGSDDRFRYIVRADGRRDEILHPTLTFQEAEQRRLDEPRADQCRSDFALPARASLSVVKTGQLKREHAVELVPCLVPRE